MTNNKWFCTGGIDQHAFHTNAVESDDRFYMCVQGDGRDPYVVYYDKNEETWSAAVKIADTWKSTDGHGAPALCRDANGYLHAWFGAHDTKIQYYRSTNPDDISAWTEYTTASFKARTGTYPNPFLIPDTNTILCFYRTGSSAYDYNLVSSTDGGANWSTDSRIFDYTGTNLAYFEDMGHWMEEVDGTWSINLCFTYHNYTPLNFRTDMFYCRYNCSNSNIYDIAGNNLGTSITYPTATASLRIKDTNDRRCWGGAFTRRDGTGTPMVVFNYETSSLSYCWASLEWDGAAWTNERFLTNSDGYSYMVNALWNVDGKAVTFITTGSAGGDLSMWEYDWDNKLWTMKDTPFKMADCPFAGNGWRVIVREPTDTRMMVFQEVGTTPYVFAAGIIGDDDVPRYLMDKYTKRMYFQARASPEPRPYTRPLIEIDEGLYLGDFLGGLSGAGLTTTTEDLQHIFSMSTTYTAETVHNDFDTTTPENIFPLLLGEDVPSGSIVWYDNLLMEYGMTHQGWHKTFITPPLKTSYTFSDMVGINLYTDQQYRLDTVVYGPSMLELRGTSYPRFRMYVWRATDSFGRTLVDEVSTVSCPTKSDPMLHTLTGFFERVPLETKFTASAGDRIAVEILTVDQADYEEEPSGVAPGTINLASHVFGIAGSDSSGDARSYIEFVTDGYSPSFSKYVDNARTMVYNLSNGYTATNIFAWDVNGIITSAVSSSYNIRKGLEDIFSMETSTTLAGRCSLKISGDTSLAIVGDSIYNYYTSTRFYQNRFQEKRASLNKFFTIDDFENYYSTSDASSSWIFETRSEFPRGALARKVFSEPQNLSNYNLISFYSKASGNTLFGIFLKDSSNYTSPVTWFPISRRPGRYEYSLDVHSIYAASVTSVNFIFPYADTVWLDDIVLLDMRSESIEREWMPINLVDLETSKQAKINTIKIPFRRGETIQHHGEHSARGSFILRSIDNRDTNFLAECEMDGIPLYLRAKNAGIPIWVLSHQAAFRNYSEKGLKSEIIVDFAEIYNSEY